MPYSKEAPRDLQAPWHTFVGGSFSGKAILDIGAGRGLSKARLSVNGNVITTSDINRNLMNDVDLIEYPERINGAWDIVTAFDVIEHVPHATEFLKSMADLSREAIFVTTPNVELVPHPWHYTTRQFEDLFYAAGIGFLELLYYVRVKENGRDMVSPCGKEVFHVPRSSHALGIQARFV